MIKKTGFLLFALLLVVSNITSSAFAFMAPGAIVTESLNPLVISGCDEVQEYILEYDDAQKEVRRQNVGEENVPWAPLYNADRYESELLTVKEGFAFPDAYIAQFQHELTELQVDYLAFTDSEAQDFGWVLYSSTDDDAEMAYMHFKQPVVLWSSTENHIETTVLVDVMKYDTIGLFTPAALLAGTPELQGFGLGATFVSDIVTSTEDSVVFNYSLTINGTGMMTYLNPEDPAGFLVRSDKAEACTISINRNGKMTFKKNSSCTQWQLAGESFTETWTADSLTSDFNINESVLSGPNVEYSLTSMDLAERIAVEKSVFNVRDYGAIGNGLTLDTSAINNTIDACSAAGGGMVYFPPGMYLSGSIHLKSDITIKLGSGATICGTRDMTKYDPREYNPYDIYTWDSSQSYFERSLIWGKNLTNVGIIGPGTIDGNDAFEPWGDVVHRSPPPPLCWLASTLMYQTDPLIFERGAKSIALKSTDNILIKDVSVRHSSDIAVFIGNATNTLIDRYRAQNVRVDGVDPICCSNFTINHCEIKSLDDSVAIKNSYLLGCRCDTENLTIKDTLISHFVNGLKIGTESVGDFKNVRYHNCIIHNSSLLPSYAGISIISVDGGTIDNFSATDITMKNIGYPIFIRLGDQMDRSPDPKIGKISNITISNVTATGAANCALILGLEEKAVGTGINLSNIDITFKGGGKKSDTYRDINEKSESDGVYPDPPYLLDGEPPAYGFYCRHVDGLTLSNVKVAFDRSDLRAAFVCDDVDNLVLNNFEAEKALFGAPSVVCQGNPVTDEDTDWLMHPIDSRYRGANALGPGDINKDGFTDYVTNYEFSQRYVISLHPGEDGDLNEPWPTVDVFKPMPPNEKKGVNPEHAALADVDGDGNLDVICAQGDSSALLEWWEGNEPGIRVIWGPGADDVTDESAWIDGGRIPVTIDRGHFHWVAPYDVNGDGAMDIVAGGRINDANRLKAGVSWIEAPNNLLARRDLSMWQIHYIDPDQTGGHGFIFSDVDGDGDDDIVLANADFDTPENEEALLWYKNPGSGTSGILTIRPTSDYSISIPNKNPIVSSGTHWDKVDEPWADGTSTEIWTGLSLWRNDLFKHGFDDSDYPSGTISKVRICATLQTLVSTAPNAKPVIYDGSVKIGTAWTVNPGYKLYTQDITGLRTSWTWNDIRNLKFGISLKKDGLVNTTGCTQVYLEVEYNGPNGTGSAAQRAAWPKHTIYQGSEFSGKPQVVAVDLNGDGRKDLITQTANNIYYFKKTSIAPVSFEMIIIPKDPIAQYFSRTLNVADLGNNGKLDIIGMLVHEGSAIPGDKAAVFWMEYSGDEPLADNWKTHVIKWGAGRTNQVSEFGEKWDQAEVVDIDDDGDLDIVANCEEWWEDGWGIAPFWNENVSPATAAVVWFENRLNEDPYTFDENSGVSDFVNVEIRTGVVRLEGGEGDDVTAFNDDFEGPEAPCFSCFDKWQGGDWECANDTSSSPTQSAKASESHDDILYTDDIDLSNATEATLEFSYRHYATDADDFTLYFYDGTTGAFPTGWNVIGELGKRYMDNRWHNYSIPIDVDKYGISNFKVGFDADLGWVLPSIEEEAWIDDVVVNKKTERTTAGSITSVTIIPDELDSWGTFTAIHTLPTGTNITYSITDVSGDNDISYITADEAAAGYDLSSALGNATSIKLHAYLTGDGVATPVLDEWQVTWSYDLETHIWNDTFDDFCVIEAEHYSSLNDGTWIKRANYEGYGGDGYMQDHNAVESAARNWVDSYGLEYAFSVEGGLYYVWLRQWVPLEWGNPVSTLGGKKSDSASVKIDCESIDQIYENSANVFDQWTWIRTTDPVVLNGGSHLITVRVGEGGYALDRIILTPDEDYVPSGIGSVETLYHP